jgi:hypothetical protein
MTRMMMALWAALALGFMSSTAHAQDDWPNMTGVWSGTSESVVIGDTLHHEPGDMPHLSSLTFTFTIEGQDGRRFWGMLSSPHDTEPVVGVIANDRHTLYFADSDGYGFVELVSDDVMDVCYVHATESSQVAACITHTRQP